MKTTSSKQPSYLRLHQADAYSGSPESGSNEMATFWQTFSTATGWRLDNRAHRLGPPRLLPNDAPERDATAMPKEAARSLADAAARVIVRLREAEQAIRCQEAELVAQLQPLATTEQQAEFADNLTDVLQQAAAATDGVAAGLYLLDDETSALKLRAMYGLEERALATPARPLRGALADLEAMISGVVMIEDCASQDEVYESPEPFAAALCIAICDGETPIGTLWVWHPTPMQFGDAAAATMRMAAECLLHRIQDQRRLRKPTAPDHETKAALRAISLWQERQVPPALPIAAGFHVDGLTRSSAPVAASWHAWDVLPSGMLSLAVAQAHSADADAAMVAATGRAAWEAHSAYRLSPRQILQRVSDTLWQSSTGDQLLSLLCAHLDPKSGEGWLASAGSVAAMVLSQYGYRSLTSSSQPLCSFPDFHATESELRLQPGEALWLATGDMMEAPDDQTHVWTQHHIHQRVIDAWQGGAREIIPSIHRELARQAAPGERTVCILCRELPS